jgi:hypothetical protein
MKVCEIIVPAVKTLILDKCDLNLHTIHNQLGVFLEKANCDVSVVDDGMVDDGMVDGIGEVEDSTGVDSNWTWVALTQQIVTEPIFTVEVEGQGQGKKYKKKYFFSYQTNKSFIF